jgi:hypothetical protein
MQLQLLYKKFSQAIRWNAALYIIHKLSSTVLSFILFKQCKHQDFSLLTNINALLFLSLLWLDFGFRKSIPRFSPLFARNKQAFVSFTKTILIFQCTSLVLATPFFIYLMPRFLTILFQQQIPQSYTTIATAVFVCEGISELMRLIYHAHFWNKQFNLLATIVRILETITCFILIYANHSTLILEILIAKCIAGITIIIGSLTMIQKLYTKFNFEKHDTVNIKAAWQGFIKHSTVMWSYNSLKSLSERNFLLPVLTYLLGAETANMFKVAQDGALFFERCVVKTIGTTDTALLAHVEGEGKTVQENAFKNLTHKVAGLCFPLFGILLFLSLQKSNYFFSSPMIFNTFLLLAVTYLLEVLLSPYERLLEVKRKYRLLMISYAPYILMISLLFYLVPFFGLLGFVCIMQGVRLVSSLLMSLCAHWYYKPTFAWRHTSVLFGIYSSLAIGLHVITSYFHTSL